MIDRELRDGEINEFDRQEEITETIAWNIELGEPIACFERKSPEERAYKVKKMFFSGAEDGTEGYSDEMTEWFYRWYVHPINRMAKRRAMFRVFMEGFQAIRT